nr:MAG TPA: protein of unknown function (DUF5320) [Caudoviricetes sp.]
MAKYLFSEKWYLDNSEIIKKRYEALEVKLEEIKKIID